MFHVKQLLSYQHINVGDGQAIMERKVYTIGNKPSGAAHSGVNIAGRYEQTGKSLVSAE